MTFTVVIEHNLLDSGLQVFRGRTADDESVRFVGPRRLTGRTPSPGEIWQIAGEWQQHPDHGQQVGIESAMMLRPSGQLVVQTLAHSAEFPGIGVVRATHLWEHFGEDLLDRLDELDPTPFVEVLGEALAQVLVQGWLAVEVDTKTYAWLMRHGFPVGLSKKLAAIYRQVPVPSQHAAAAAAVGIPVWHIEQDPYRMLAFLGWKTTDRAAMRMGIDPLDPRRLVGAVEHGLSVQIRKGHTWTPASDLPWRVARLAKVSIADARRGVDLALRCAAITEIGGGYQPAGAAVMEAYVGDRIRHMISGEFRAEQLRLTPRATGAIVADALAEHEQAQGYRLNDAQRDAVWMAVTRDFCLLLGGPGVGKTTVLKAVLVAGEQLGIHTFQAALSGRAAMRMKEATGSRAYTIASLLNRIDAGDVVLADDSMVIVDEASMIDLATLYRLFRRMPPGARLLLVGDPGQLPPIGFGLTLHAFADSSLVPRTRLTEVLRQTEASGIPAVVEGIRAGREPALSRFLHDMRTGVSFVEAHPEGVTDAVVALLSVLPRDDVQIVGSVKNGAGAVQEINTRLHTLCAVGRTPVHGNLFVGEPVLATRNDYTLGIMNGELGVVVGDVAGGLCCRFGDEEKVLPPSYGHEHVEVGYAITCHKAQGSQFRRVIIPVTRSGLLDRSLLLTAVSRAQEQAVLVGDIAAFREAVHNPPASDRRVGLRMRLDIAHPR